MPMRVACYLGGVTSVAANAQLSQNLSTSPPLPSIRCAAAVQQLKLPHKLFEGSRDTPHLALTFPYHAALAMPDTNTSHARARRGLFCHKVHELNT